MSVSTDAGWQDRRRQPWRQRLSLLRTRWYDVVGGILIGLGLGIAAATLLPQSYTATALVLLKPLTADPFDQLGSGATGVEVATASQVAASLETSSKVLPTLPDAADLDAVELLEPLGVTPDGETAVLAFSYQDADAQVAVERANAFATVYLADRGRQADAALEQSRMNLREQLAEIQQEREALIQDLATLSVLPDEDDPRNPQIEGRLTVLRTRAAITENQLNSLAGPGISGGQLITPATTPEQPDGLGLAAWLALGTLVGVMLALGLPQLHEMLTTKVTSGGAAQLQAGIPALGYVDMAKASISDRTVHDHPALHRAASLLGSRASLDDRVVVLLPIAHEDTAVACLVPFADGLASRMGRVVATAGHLTTLDADDTVAKLRRQAHVDSGRPTWVHQGEYTEADRASVDQQPGDDPTTLEGATRALTTHYEVVVAAAPPLTSDAAALDIAVNLNAVVVPVVEVGSATREDLRLALRDLAANHVEVPGMIIVGPHRLWGSSDPFQHTGLTDPDLVARHSSATAR